MRSNAFMWWVCTCYYNMPQRRLPIDDVDISFKKFTGRGRVVANIGIENQVAFLHEPTSGVVLELIDGEIQPVGSMETHGMSSASATFREPNYVQGYTTNLAYSPSVLAFNPGSETFFTFAPADSDNGHNLNEVGAASMGEGSADGQAFSGNVGVAVEDRGNGNARVEVISIDSIGNGENFRSNEFPIADVEDVYAGPGRFGEQHIFAYSTSDENFQVISVDSDNFMTDQGTIGDANLNGKTGWLFIPDETVALVYSPNNGTLATVNMDESDGSWPNIIQTMTSEQLASSSNYQASPTISTSCISLNYDDNTAVIGTRDGQSLVMADVSDVSDPAITNSYDLESMDEMTDVQFNVETGNLWVVGDGEEVIQVWEYIDGSTMSKIASLSQAYPGISYNFHRKGDYHIAVKDATGEILTLDFSDPDNPTLASGTQMSDAAYTSTSTVDGNILYAAGYGGEYFNAIDISRPLSPKKLSSDNSVQFSFPNDIATYKDYAYVADDSGDTHVFDISDPSGVTHEALIGKAGFGDIISLKIIDDTVYALDRQTSHLTVATLSDPLDPDVTDTVSASDISWPAPIETFGNIAVIPHISDERIGVFDISEPTSPELVSYLGMNGSHRAIPDDDRMHTASYFDSGTLYAVGERYIDAWDLSSPQSPKLVDSEITDIFGIRTEIIPTDRGSVLLAGYDRGNIEEFDIK